MNMQEALDHDLVQLYKWSDPKEVLKTQYGRIPVREWLAREEQRIVSDPTRTAEVVEHCGLMSLFVDPVV